MVLDLETEPAIRPLIELLRALTRTDTSSDVLWTFMHQFGKIRAIDYFLGIAPVEKDPGAYRIMYKVVVGHPEKSWYQREMTAAGMAKLPVVRGGFIERIMAGGAPCAMRELDLTGDPVLPADVSGSTVCMALPVYVGDRVQEWSFGFSRGQRPIEGRDVVQATLTANLLGIANRHLDSLQEIKRLNSALSGQLEQIAALQQALLPNRLPEMSGVAIATSYLTSDQSGGDYYDFFPLADGRWGILIADVSGHGAAAATVTAMLHAILHGYEPSDPAHALDPSRVMEYANRRLSAAGLEGNFVTAFFGVLDPQSGELAFSNAGHNPPRVWRARAKRIEHLDGAATLPLGIVPAIAAERGAITLEPGDTLVLYTDGITEAFSVGVKPEQYGVERLDRAIAEVGGAPDAVVEAVHRTLFEHRGSATRADDQTLVAVHRRYSDARGGRTRS